MEHSACYGWITPLEFSTKHRTIVLTNGKGIGLGRNQMDKTLKYVQWIVRKLISYKKKALHTNYTLMPSLNSAYWKDSVQAWDLKTRWSNERLLVTTYVKTHRILEIKSSFVNLLPFILIILWTSHWKKSGDTLQYCKMYEEWINQDKYYLEGIRW